MPKTNKERRMVAAAGTVFADPGADPLAPAGPKAETDKGRLTALRNKKRRSGDFLMQRTPHKRPTPTKERADAAPKQAGRSKGRGRNG